RTAETARPLHPFLAAARGDRSAFHDLALDRPCNGLEFDVEQRSEDDVDLLSFGIRPAAEGTQRAAVEEPPHELVPASRGQPREPRSFAHVYLDEASPVADRPGSPVLAPFPRRRGHGIVSSPAIAGRGVGHTTPRFTGATRPATRRHPSRFAR